MAIVLEEDDTRQCIEAILEHYNDLEKLMDLVVGLLPAFSDNSRTDCSVAEDKLYLINKINKILKEK